MAHSIDPVADEFIPRVHPYFRPCALLLLLLCEAVLYTIRFDTPVHLGQGHWWGFLFYKAHLISCSMLVIPIAIAALGGFRLLIRLRRAFELQALNHDRWTYFLMAHVLTLVGFVLLSLVVCDGNVRASAHPGAWGLVWVLSGLSVAATWMATWLPLSTWISLIRRSRREIVMSVSVASIAYFLGDYTGQLWDLMAGTTLKLVQLMLGLVTQNFVCDAQTNEVSLDGFKVQISAACSGLEGIGLILAFLSAYLWWFRSLMRWPQSFALLPLGAVVIFLLNSVRIASLVMIGAWASPEVAVGAFHSQAGWLVFLGISLGLVAATRRSSIFAVVPANSEPAAGSNPSAAFLVPFLAILATSMITGAFASGFDRLYGLRVLTGGVALWYFRREFVGLIRGCSWFGVATGVVAFGLWVALEPASTGSGRALASAVHGMSQGQAWAWIALRVIGSVAIVPVVEELAFRGFLTRRLSSIDFQSIPLGRLYWPTLLISSAAFGLLHGRWLAGMLVGVLYGLALCRRGKLGDAIIAHAVTNGLIAATVLATGDWTMWT